MSRLNNKALIGLCLFVTTTLISTAHAAGMQVTPGLWETTSTVTSLAGTQENVSQECITEPEMSPMKMVKDAPNCKITDSNVNASSMQWTMQCDQGGASMTGNGQVTSSGDAISGGMDLTAVLGGQEVSMNTKWEGKRLGDCE